MEPFCTVLVDGKLCGEEPFGGCEVALRSGEIGVILTCRTHRDAEFKHRGKGTAAVKIVSRIAWEPAWVALPDPDAPYYNGPDDPRCGSGKCGNCPRCNNLEASK